MRAAVIAKPREGALELRLTADGLGPGAVDDAEGTKAPTAMPSTAPNCGALGDARRGLGLYELEYDVVGGSPNDEVRCGPLHAEVSREGGVNDRAART